MNKKISFADIKNSPVVVIVAMAILIIGVIVVTVFLAKDIWTMKAQIAEVRTEYEENLVQQAYLEDLRDKSNAMNIEKEMMDRALPPTMDIYLLKEEMYEVFDDFSLTATDFKDPVISTSFTTETTMEFTVTGTEANIIAFCRHFTGSEQLHRIEAFSLANAANDSGAQLKQAAIILVKLSK